MDKNKYYDEICKMIMDEIDGDYDIESISVYHGHKNNGVDRTGFAFKVKDIGLMPCIYPEPSVLEGIYNSGDEKEKEMMAKQIVSGFLKSVKNIGNAWDPKSFTLEDNKESIIFALVNQDKNKEMLSTCPYIVFNDLAIVFRVYCCIDNSNGSILIDNNIAALWDVDTEELWNLAIENMTRDFPYFFESLSGIVEPVLCMRSGEDPGDYCEGPDLSKCGSMYILSNNKFYYGAGALLYKELAYDIYRRLGSDYYILPSSVNETIIIPESTFWDVDYLKYMVSDVNNCAVSATDYLSDSVYFYDHECDRITIV